MSVILDRFRMTNNPDKCNAITHSGTFHGDEVMATAILIHFCCTPAGHKRFPEGLRLFRGTDEDVSRFKGRLVYDIGGGEYDHHDKNHMEYRENNVPYASCGLIWRRFGGPVSEAWGINPSMIDKNICEGIDARDNGVTIRNTATLGLSSENVNIAPLTFSDIVFSMNPNYTEPRNKEYSNAMFASAVEMAARILDRELQKLSAANAAKEYLQHYIIEAAESPNPDILVMDVFIPWKAALLKFKDVYAENIKAVIYESPREGYQWMLAPVKINSFETRVNCPEYLKGLRKDDLVKLGYHDGLFVHPTGFTGGAGSIETCIRMLRDIIDYKKPMYEGENVK